MNEIPSKVTPDQYDKLMRRLWELELKVQGVNRATLDCIGLEQVFEQNRTLEKTISDMRKQISFLNSTVCRLAEAERYRIERALKK